jgi:DeoR family fructose operon transcriptional repressor
MRTRLTRIEALRGLKRSLRIALPVGMLYMRQCLSRREGNEIMGVLLPIERQEKIKQLLLEDGSVRVRKLCELLQVSEVTVRTDLNQLEEEGFLVRHHGGAVLVRHGESERSFAEQEIRFVAEKRRIGAAAAEMVQPGETIILDVGTTLTQMARLLQHKENLVVVTNGLNIALELEKYAKIDVLVTGGMLRRLQHSLVNPYATLILSQIHADKLFLGCNGVNATVGITNVNMQEAEVKRAMIKAAKQVIVLADSSKIGVVAAAAVADISAVDTVITDAKADREEVAALQEAGIEVLLV